MTLPSHITPRPKKNEFPCSVTSEMMGVRWKLNSVALVYERTTPTERPPLLGKILEQTFADRRCCVVSVTDPYGNILGLLDRSRYFCFQVAPQLYSRG
jgi:hypothetical protein